MNKRSAEINFIHFLDRELNIESGWKLPWHRPARESRELLPVVTRLANLEFAAVSPEQAALKARWVAGMSDVQRQAPERKPALRWARVWIPILLLLAALLFAFRQPLQTVFANMLGYGYIEGVGFFKLDSAHVLSGPVMQQHEGESLTVLRGLSDAGETRIWLHASDATVDFSGIWLETADGTELPVMGWQMLTDAAHSGETLLSFQPLTGKQMQVTLIFPAGWHLPLQFISGAEWQDRVNRTPSALTVPYTTPTATIAPTVLNPCVSPQGFQVCIRDAAYSSDGLQVLLGSDAGTNSFIPISMEADMELVAVNPLNQDDQAVLEAGGKQSSIEVTQFPQGIIQDGKDIQQALTFPVDASAHGTAKLTIPAFTAMVELPQPVMITVDLGANPQSGQTVPLPADIQIAGHTIHFDSATIEDNGVNSLRLTLTSAPLEAKDGWMVSLLDLGRPEGIADRYGSGSLDADRRLKVFTELFDDNGKIKTGQLNLPVIDAVVLFTGPFEFTFALPDASTGTVLQTPTIVSGDSFNPQPTPTPLSLDSYSYRGESLQANDLLFTVTHDTTTDLYAQQPDETTPRLIATLPGQVYQVYVHPDLQGIDYLAGTKVTVDYQEPYFKNAGLFSLNFGDARPRLLVTFPTGPSSMQGGGTQVTDATWSADGQIMAFELNGLQASQGQPSRKMGWIDLSCRESGNCAIQYLNPPDPALDLYFPQFSPQGRMLLLAGVSLSGTGSGAGQIYLLIFGADGQPGELNKVTRSDMDDEENPRWMADGNSLLIECLDMNTDLNDVHLCQWNLSEGVRTELMDANDYLTRPLLRWAVLSPLDDLLVDMGLDQNQPELRIFNRKTLTVNLIPQSDDLSGFVFTQDEKILYVRDVKGETIGAVDLATMTQRTLSTQSGGGFISWIGVVNRS